MSGQGQVAKATEIDVKNDDTIENKDLLDDVETVTNEDPNKGKANEAAKTTTKTSLEDTAMEPQETVVAPVAPNPPAPAKMETPPPKKKTPPPPVPKKETPPPAPKKETPPPPKKKTPPPPPAPKKETPPPPPPKKETPPPPKKKLDPIVDVPIKKALQKSQDLMHRFDIASKNTGMCVGYFKVEGTDAQVLAACAKTPENTCPATFNADSCVALKPVNVDVTKGAKVMMF